MLAMKKIRERLGLTQVAVAHELGVSRQTYNNWELGKRQADYEYLLRLGELFDTTVENILTGCLENASPLTDNQAHLAKLVADTRPDGLTGAAKVVLGAAINKAKKEVPDRAENPKVKKCAAKLAKMTDAELAEMNNYLNFLIWKRDQSLSED